MADSSDILTLEVKDLFTKFTNDVIATAAFGIQCNTLQNSDNEFYRMGKEFIKFSILRLIVFIGYIVIPNVMKVLSLCLINIVTQKCSQSFQSFITPTNAQ
jgi:cytochrome P450 family 9